MKQMQENPPSEPTPIFDHISRTERIKRASRALHNHEECTDTEAVRWAQETNFEIRMAQLFNGWDAYKQAQSVHGEFVNDVRAWLEGKLEAEEAQH